MNKQDSCFSLAYCHTFLFAGCISPSRS